MAALMVVSKVALNEGMSIFTFVVYCHAFAIVVIAPLAFAFERNAGFRITRSILLKIMAMGLLETVLDQNLYYLGMKFTSATFTAAVSNILPAVTFILAWIFRLEIVHLKEIGSLAKLVGTLISISGAMAMTFYKGPIIGDGTSRLGNHHAAESAHKNMVAGAISLAIACASWAGFVIIQAFTLREYPFEFSLAAWICLAGTVEGTVVALVIDRGRMSAWVIGWNSELLAIIFAAFVHSVMAYCLQGSVMKARGPVFVTAFSPLRMILVAVAGLLLLGEDLFLGGVMGSLLIMLGLYMTLWGKSKDPVPTATKGEMVGKVATDEENQEHVPEHP